MATVSSKTLGNQIITCIGGTATATTGTAAVVSIANVNIPVLHFEIDDGETITSINLFLRTDQSGVVTNYKKTITTS